MALTERDGNSYGEDHADVRAELIRFSEANTYVASDFVDVRCECGNDRFFLLSDEDEGVALRICNACEDEHVMGDGPDYLDDADPTQHECLCDAELFQITVGVSRYRSEDETLTDDVRWLYIGCRCPECGLVGCYAEWKNEFQGYQQLLAMM